MGQVGSKPPIRMVMPEDEHHITSMIEGTGEEPEQATDTLGVIPEEVDYPEPAPHKPKHRRDGKNISDKDEFNVDLNDDSEVNEGKDNKLEDFVQVELVPVGASFKNFSKKRKHKISFEDDNVSIVQNELTKSLNSSLTRTVTVSRSTPFRDSVLSTSRTNESDFESSHSKAKKRELMLSEREKYEFRTLFAPPSATGSHRGQVRRWTFDMPQPRSAVGFLDNFRTVEDRIAEELAEKHKNHRAESYSELVKDLNMHLKSERLKVKVILAWINKQNIGRLTFGSKLPSPDTPNGYMMLIQENHGTYPVFFALLCRAAHLKCVIIRGISKGSNYEVGSANSEFLANSWNAVYVDGTWELVHPLWACKGIANRQAAGWLKIEQEGKSTRSLSIASSGIAVHSFNPYFIFTKPEEFIIRNFPDEPKWQLLPNPISEDQFMELMYIRPIFYLNKFRLISENKAKLVSENGEPCEIKIMFPKRKGHDVLFGYELSVKLEHSKTDIEQEQQDSVKVEDLEGDELGKKDSEIAERYVMVKKLDSEVTFEVRFLKKGVYKLRLFGGYYSEFGSKPPWILDVLLECHNIVPKPLPLPFDPGTVGWGPGPITESLGLFVPSFTESSFYIDEYEEAVIYFVLQEKVFVESELHHSAIDKEQLKHFVVTNTVEKESILTLQIVVKYPGRGDYGLKISVKRNGNLENACNYMVLTRKKRPVESFYVRRAKLHLFEAMEKCDLDLLTTAIEECEKFEVPANDPEVTGGRNMFEFLSCKRELYVALLVNRIDVAEHALYRTRTANLDILLGKECAKVEEHLEHMLKLDAEGWTCEIPEIDRQSLVEISYLRKPKVEVQLVVTAMYMLLGIEEGMLKDWNKVRKYLRDQQSTLVEIARLEKYLALDTETSVMVEKSVLDRVQEILFNYTEEDIRRVDNTAAAYYKWVVGVSKKLREKIEEEESRLKILKDIEEANSKQQNSRVNSKKGVKSNAGIPAELGATNAKQNGHNVGTEGSDMSQRKSLVVDRASGKAQKDTLKQNGSKSLKHVDSFQRKRSLGTAKYMDVKDITSGPLEISGQNIPSANVQSRPSTKVVGSGSVSSRVPTKSAGKTISEPSTVSNKTNDLLKANRNGISGNTFFSEKSEKGSLTFSASRARPMK